MTWAAMRENLAEYDKVRVAVFLVLLLSAVVMAYSIYRLGAFISYKAIENHIEKKIEVMVKAEALK